jgi:hypothetical protein
MHDAMNAAMHTYPPVVSVSFSLTYLRLNKNNAPAKRGSATGIVHARHVITVRQPFALGL